MSYRPLASKVKRLGARALRGVWSGRNARERQFVTAKWAGISSSVPPIAQRLRGIKKTKSLDSQITELANSNQLAAIIQQGVLRHTHTPWESPVRLGPPRRSTRAIGAPQLRAWFTQNLDAARSPNKRRGHSKCADGLMKSWPKYDADLDPDLRAKLHFIPIGIKILTGRTGDDCAAKRTLDALSMHRTPFAQRSPRILVALGAAGPNRDRRAEVRQALSGHPDVAHVVEGHLDQNEF